jgi:hypothetical protein
VFDEVLGLAAWAAGHSIVVGNLNVSFRQLLPLQTVVQVNTRVISEQGRKIIVHGDICSLEGIVIATGEALCIKISAENFIGEMGCVGWGLGSGGWRLEAGERPEGVNSKPSTKPCD